MQYFCVCIRIKAENFWHLLLIGPAPEYFSIPPNILKKGSFFLVVG